MDRLASAVLVALFALFLSYYLPLHIFSSWISVAVYSLLFTGAFFALSHHHAAPSSDEFEKKTKKVFEAIQENNEKKLVRLLAKSLRFEDRNVLKETQGESGRTALHLAAELGHTECAVTIVHFLTAQKKNLTKYLEREDAASLTPLMLAIARTQPTTALALLDLGCRANTKGPKSRNSVFLACLTGQADLVRGFHAALGSKEFVACATAADALGYTSAHAACLAGSADVLSILIDVGAADLTATSRDGSTPLHTAARRGDAAVVRLLALHGARLTACRFGCTPLHTACMNGRVDAVRELVRAYPLDRLVAQDHDGLHPPHTVIQALGTATAKAATAAPGDAQESIQRLLECFRILIEAGYPVDCKDYSNSTLAYLLCWSSDRPQLNALKFLFEFLEKNNRTHEITLLLRAKADSGWTCMHAAKHMPGPASSDVTALLQRMAGEYAPEMVTMELSATRDVSNTGYLSRRGAHNAVPEDERRAVLRGDHTLAGVAGYLRRIVSTGRMPRIVVLCGAGISTSAGIKDFRSATGLYAGKPTSRVFTADFYEQNPRQFYDVVLNEFGPMLHGALPKPTPAHALLRVFRDAGWLLRVYTQNIDHLERDVGLQAGEIVECHGSLFRTVCRVCNARNEDPAHVSQFWKTVEERDQPLCACGGILRPDVVLFGEPLPMRFHQLAYSDVAACDLLLVMGTSLVVYPVASLPSFVGPLTPRVLFNREPSGCFQGLSPCNTSDSNAASMLAPPTPTQATTPTLTTPTTPTPAAHYRDVYYQGGCDEAAIEFADALGLGTALTQALAH